MFSFFIFFGIVIIFYIIYSIVKGRGVQEAEEDTEISGIIIGKYDDKPVENVVVMLGKVDVNNKRDNVFKKISDYEVKTDKNGKYTFKNIGYANYFVYAEYNGKKVLSYVRIDKNIKYVDDLILKV